MASETRREADTQAQAPQSPFAPQGSVLEVLGVFFRLGCTSFGGPVAHLGYFRDELVTRRRWLDDRAYADLVALCQFMPGPASSQVGIALGLGRAGPLGALAAWIGFTLPSALILALFALSLATLGDISQAGWLAGLKAVAVAVVAQALWGMGRSLCPDAPRATLAVAGAAIALGLGGAGGQLAAIGLGAVVGLALYREAPPAPAAPLGARVSKIAGAACLLVFLALLAGLPLLVSSLAADPRGLSPEAQQAVRLVDGFYRSGSLVFGGGHVVLPLLEAEVVEPGWVSPDAFVAGYGAAQAVPGPLFTFAAFLGGAMVPAPTGLAGAALCVFAIFLPSFLLVFGLLPFWDDLRRAALARAALTGVNAAVVGLLLAAFYDPVWTSGVVGAREFLIAAAALVLLVAWKTPPWAVVLLAAAAGYGVDVAAEAWPLG